MLSIIKKLVLAAAIIIFVSAGNLIAADDVKSNEPIQGTPEYDNQVILRVNEVEVTRVKFKAIVEKLIPSMGMHSSVSDERREKTRVTAVKGMIDDILVEAEAVKDADVAASIAKKDIEAEVEALTKRLPKGVTLKQAMKNSKMDKKELRAFFRKQLQTQRFYAKMRKQSATQAEATVDEAYAKEYYEKNLSKFKVPEQVHMRMILLKADPSGGTMVWSAVYKRATELIEKARAGEDFGKLAKEFSEDKQTAEKDGDMGWLHRGSMMEEIDTMSANMKPGDVSEPINTLYGYVVVKLEDVKPEVQRTFEEINREKLKVELREKLAKTLYDDWIKSLWAAAKIEYLSDEVRLKDKDLLK